LAVDKRSTLLSKILRKIGAEILYLPPYSPDFNKIEHQWLAIKNRARKNIHLFKSFGLTVYSAFL